MDAGHFNFQPHLVTRKLIFPWGRGGKSKNFERDHILFIERRREGESAALIDCKRGPWKTFFNEGDH